MIYLVSKFPCLIVGKQTFVLQEDVKYCIEDIDDSYYFVSGLHGEQMFMVNFSKIESSSLEYVRAINLGRDKYVFLLPLLNKQNQYLSLKLGGIEYQLNISSQLTITVDGDVLLTKNNVDISYSHSESVGDNAIIYFEGDRDFVIVMKQREVIYADFYDEINIEANERYFLTKRRDSLNHGTVCHVGEDKNEQYLVYLDDYELKMKHELELGVFLDCVKSGNNKYCEELLDKSIRPVESTAILEFFPKFSDYYLVDDKTAILFTDSKNAHTGKFAKINLSVVNIMYNLDKISNISISD